MENNEISVNGNFAVKVGKMWAYESYENIKLDKQPCALYTFKKAFALAEKIGGNVYIFKPTEIDEEKLAELKLAAAEENNE